MAGFFTDHGREVIVRCALVFLVETEYLVPEGVGLIELSDHGLVASVRGHPGRPRHLVKGATDHRPAFERSGRGYGARVVLDV